MIPTALPVSSFNGKIFVSTAHDVRKMSMVPSVLLAASNPLWELWQCHLTALTQPGSLFEGVVDALAAIFLGDPHWRDSATPADVIQKRSAIRSLLTLTPPNLIVLKNFKHYGYHERCYPLWNYVCLSKRFVKLWMDAESSDAWQGLSALLITAIDHELGHWIQSIKLRYGYSSLPSSVPLSTDGLKTDDLSTDLVTDLSESSSDESPPPSPSPIPNTSESADEHDDTAKMFHAPWNTENGEAGNFVEVSTRGGIMEYDAAIKKPYLVVGPRESDMHYLDDSYTINYIHNEGPPELLCFFPPRNPRHGAGLRMQGINFPFNDVDKCPSTDLYCQNFHGYVPTKTHKL